MRKPIYTPPPADSDAPLDCVELAVVEMLIAMLVEELQQEAQTTTTSTVEAERTEG